MSSEFISIDKVPTLAEVHIDDAWETDMPLVWGVPLPGHVDQERIEINLSRLRSMHKVGYLVSSVVREYYEDQDHEVDSTVAGINEDGSANAANLSTAKKAEISKGAIKTNPMFDDFNNTIKVGWGKSVSLHNVSRDAVVDEVIRLKQKGKDDEGAWAKTLDRSFRSSMRQSAAENLLPKAGIRAQTFAINSLLLAPTSLSLAMLDPRGVVLSTFGLATSQLIAAALIGQTEFLPKFNDRLLDQKRWSFVPLGVHPESYVALNAMTRVPKLIRARE